MTKKYTLAKKLTCYSAIASAVLAMPSATAQIIFTDVNPDSSFGLDYSGNKYLLDLNNDGINDFKLDYTEKTSHNPKGGTVSSNLIDSGFGKNEINRQKFIDDEIIQSDSTEWKSELVLAHFFESAFPQGSYFSHSSTEAGSFFSTPDSYVGLKVYKKGKIYYGWVRLSTYRAEDETIKSYAMDTIPNQLIQAGYTGCYSNHITAITASANNDTLFSTVADKYQWYENNIAISGDTNHYLNPVSNGNYNVITKDIAGCSSISKPYLFINCTILYPPVYSVNSTTICPSFGKDTLELNLGKYISFQWYKNDTVILNATSPLYVATAPGNYSVKFVDIYGCSGSSSADTIKIDPLPNPPVIALFSGDTLVFSAKHNMWFMDLSGSLNYISQSDSEYFVPYFNSPCLAEALDSLGCPSPPSNILFDFISCKKAIPYIYTPTPFVCFPDSIEFLFNTFQYNQDSLKSHWVRNDSDLAISDTNFYVHQSGNYSIIVNQGYGCPLDTSNILAVQIDTVPKPSITRNNDTLISSSLSGNQWYLNGARINDATGSKFTIDKDGNYSVTVTDANGCSSASDIYPETLTGINNSAIENLKVYVSNNQLYVQLPDIFYIGGTLRVYNSLGEIVTQQNISSENPTVDLQSLSSGIYIVKLEKNGEQVVRKVFID